MRTESASVSESLSLATNISGICCPSMGDGVEEDCGTANPKARLIRTAIRINTRLVRGLRPGIIVPPVHFEIHSYDTIIDSKKQVHMKNTLPIKEKKYIIKK